MKFQILICDGPSCGVTHDSDQLVECARAHLADRPDLAAGVELVRFTCFDHCDDGPNLFVRELADGETPSEPDGALFSSQRGFYEHMDEDKLRRLLDEHCTTGEPIEDLVTDY